MSMPTGKQPESGPLSRAIAAEIRAIMARRRINGTQLSSWSGMSRGYFGKRMRDSAPFSLNDVEAICKALGEDLTEFLLIAARSMGD